MAPLIYPEPTWSNRFGRVVRTLQIVAVAGAIGAVGGGVAVMALVGGGSSSRPPTVLNVSTADHAGAAPPAGAAPLAAQPDAAKATAQGGPAVAPAAIAAAEQQSPAAAEPPSNAAAVEQHPVQQAAAPANSAAGTHLYNRVEAEQNAAPADVPRARAKVTRRIAKTPEYGRGERGVPYPDDRGGPYSGARYSYRDYPPPPAAPRSYYFGGGGQFYDRGSWGSWGN